MRAHPNSFPGSVHQIVTAIDVWECDNFSQVTLTQVGNDGIPRSNKEFFAPAVLLSPSSHSFSDKPNYCTTRPLLQKVDIRSHRLDRPNILQKN